MEVGKPTTSIISGVSRISFRGGGGWVKIFLEKGVYLHGAFARIVRGHAPQRKY